MTFKERKTLRRKIVAAIKSGISREQVALDFGIPKSRVSNYYHYEEVRLGKGSTRKYNIRDISKHADRQLKGHAQIYRISAMELDTELARNLVAALRETFNISKGDTKVFEIVVAI